jgi:hypothetical protein
MACVDLCESAGILLAWRCGEHRVGAKGGLVMGRSKEV